MSAGETSAPCGGDSRCRRQISGSKCRAYLHCCTPTCTCYALATCRLNGRFSDAWTNVNKIPSCDWEQSFWWVWILWCYSMRVSLIIFVAAPPFVRFGGHPLLTTSASMSRRTDKNDWLRKERGDARPPQSLSAYALETSKKSREGIVFPVKHAW